MYRRFFPKLLASLTASSLLCWTIGCSPKPESETTSSEEVSTPESTMSQELTEDQKIYRTLGYWIGTDIMESCSEDERKQMLAGLQMAAGGDAPEFAEEFRDKAFQTMNEQRNRRAQEQRESEITVNKAAGEAFLDSLDGKDGISKTDSGLRYEILQAGSDKFATSSDTVKIHYHGTLIDGSVFDSSVQRGEPAVFPLSGVIQGFSEGLTLVGLGGKIKLYMPSDIAYGDRGSGGAIGPGTTLIFEVELLEINP